MVDRISDSINKIKTNERIGRRECVLESTKLMKSVLGVMKKEGYVQDFAEFTEGKFKKVKVTLANRINAIGAVKPRIAISASDIQRYETRYIPSRDFGILVISTPQGLMTNREAREKGVGGRLIAYMY